MEKNFISVLVLLLVFFFSSNAMSLDLKVSVYNWSKDFSGDFVVTGGVPLPENEVFHVENLAIYDVEGNEIPSQFKILRHWPKNKKSDHIPSIKWVLCDFQVSSGNNEIGSFFLRYKKEDSPQKEFGNSLNVTEESGVFTVDTGRIKFELSDRSSFHIFKKLWSDVNRNGNYEKSELIFSTDFVDKSGATVIYDNSVENQFNSDVLHLSGLKNPDLIRVEEQGSQKVVFRIEGRHYASDEGISLGLYGYRVFVTAYAGKPYVDIVWSLTNTLMTGKSPIDSKDRRTIYSWPFKKYSIYLSPKFTIKDTYIGGGKNVFTDNDIKILQERGQFSVTQGNSLKKIDGEIPGALLIKGDEHSVALSVRYFSPNNPISLGSQENQVFFEPIPDIGVTRSLDPLTQKTWRFRIGFFDGNWGSEDLSRFNAQTQHPARLLADPEWYRDTQAWDGGFAIPPGIKRLPSSQWTYLEEVSDAARDEYGVNSGWNRFGYIPSFNGPGDHWNLSSAFWKYLITGNPKDFQLAEVRTHYFNDLVSVHLPSNRQEVLSYDLHAEDDLKKYRRLKNPQFNYNSKIQTFPGFEWNRQNKPDTGHMINYELMEYFLLTGDWATFDSILDEGIRAAAVILYRTYGLYGGWQLDENNGEPADPEQFMVMPYGPRYVGRPLFVVTQAYSLTGDEVFLRPARLYAYNLRNYAKRDPIGYISGLEAAGEVPPYTDTWVRRWKEDFPETEPPVSAVTALFQTAIAVEGMYKYWEETRDEEILDAIILSGEFFERIAVKEEGKYRGWNYTWADFWSQGKRFESGKLTATGAETLSGQAFAYLASGDRKFFDVMKSAHDVHGDVLSDKRLLNYYMGLWKKEESGFPPDTVSDLNAEPIGAKKIKVSWTAPDYDDKHRGNLFYQVKVWKNAPIVDSVKRWDPVENRGWPDLRPPLPYTKKEWVSKASSYLNTQEVSFHAATNLRGEPDFIQPGNAEEMIVEVAENGVHYFALKTWAGPPFNISSEMSNVVSVLVDK